MPIFRFWVSSGGIIDVATMLALVGLGPSKKVAPLGGPFGVNCYLNILNMNCEQPLYFPLNHLFSTVNSFG